MFVRFSNTGLSNLVFSIFSRFFQRFLVGILVYFLSVGSSYAADSLVKFIGLHVAYSDFEDQSEMGTDLENAPMFGVSTGFKTKRYSVELSIAKTQTDYDLFRQTVITIPALTIGIVEDIVSEISVVPILVNGKLYTLQNTQHFKPYIGLGGGYYFISATDERSGTRFANIVSPSTINPVDLDVKNTVGYHLGVGMDMRISSRWVMNVNGKYVFADTDLTYRDESGSLSTLQLDLGGAVYSVSIQYLFP